MKKSSTTGFIGRNRALRQVADRVGEYNRILKALQSALPPEVARACLGAAWSGEALIVGVNSAAAATRIRYAAPDLLEALARAGWEATAILPRVQGSFREQKPIRAKDLKMGGAARDAFTELADTVEDQQLAAAIRNLLNNQSRKL
ncbi:MULTISPECIES: DciA family protein [Silvimonas]|uniref:DciA family protein n=1 Tax=Silvimonas TaxID=300264 RepID=UPI0024B3B7AC|nr:MULTISPECIES: DciA family protein [Silvimonas]MDR3430000.1 DciA family protein [Silvimonas sp.]